MPDESLYHFQLPGVKIELKLQEICHANSEERRSSAAHSNKMYGSVFGDHIPPILAKVLGNVNHYLFESVPPTTSQVAILVTTIMALLCRDNPH